MSVYYLNLTMKDEYGIEHYEIHTESCKWLDRTKYSERLGKFLIVKEL